MAGSLGLFEQGSWLAIDFGQHSLLRQVQGARRWFRKSTKVTRKLETIVETPMFVETASNSAIKPSSVMVVGAEYLRETKTDRPRIRFFGAVPTSSAKLEGARKQRLTAILPKRRIRLTSPQKMSLLVSEAQKYESSICKSLSDHRTHCVSESRSRGRQQRGST